MGAYASPAAEYAAPSYEAPAASYGAPTYEQEYAAPAYEAAPTGYDTGYGVPAAEGLDFDLRQITELIPLGYSLANCASTARPCTNNAMISAGKSLDSLNVIDMIEAASQIYEAMQ